MGRYRNACIGIAAVCAWICAPAFADDNCRGHYVGVGSWSISISDDHEEPSYILIGECRDGVCTRTDKDGDSMTVQSAYTPGEYLATWKVVSGTGKYANAKRSGWYKQTRAQGDIVVGEWGGICR